MAAGFEGLSPEEICAYVKEQIPSISDEILERFKEHEIDGSVFFGVERRVPSRDRATTGRIITDLFHYRHHGRKCYAQNLKIYAVLQGHKAASPEVVTESDLAEYRRHVTYLQQTYRSKKWTLSGRECFVFLFG